MRVHDRGRHAGVPRRNLFWRGTFRVRGMPCGHLRSDAGRHRGRSLREVPPRDFRVPGYADLRGRGVLSVPSGLLLSGKGRDGTAGVPARSDVKLRRALSRGVCPAASRAATPCSSAATSCAASAAVSAHPYRYPARPHPGPGATAGRARYCLDQSGALAARPCSGAGLPRGGGLERGEFHWRSCAGG